MIRNRALGLALIALAAPFPALALEGGGGEGTGSPGLTVSASLDSCGLADTQIMCKIDAGWNSIEGAETYSVSVTSPDGSVIDMGETSGQGTSAWVPYVGSGTYSVTVSAWGTPPGEEDDGSPEVIDRSTSMSGGDVDGVAKAPPEADSDSGRGDDGSETAGEEPPVEDLEPEDPRPETPVCDEPPVEDPPVPPAEPEPRVDGEAPEALAEPEVVDTIPADDDCTG